MILEYFGEQFPEEDCQNTCDNCFEKSRSERQNYKIVNFDSLVDKIIDSFSNNGKKLTMIQLMETLKGKDRNRLGDFSFFGAGKQYSDSTLRKIVLILLEKGFLIEKSKTLAFRKKISYELIELFQAPPSDFTMDLMVGLNTKDEGKYSSETSFQLQSLIRNSQRGKLSFKMEYYSTASIKFRELRKEFYQKCIQRDQKLKAIFEENNFTVDNLIPSNILHELCRSLPQTMEEFHKLIVFPKEFSELENKLLSCSRGIFVDLGLKPTDLMIPKNEIVKNEKDIEREIFQVTNLSFLDQDESIDEIEEAAVVQRKGLDEEKQAITEVDSDSEPEDNEDDYGLNLYDDKSKILKKINSNSSTFAEEFTTHEI
jgi:hypothetical protein